MKRRPINSIWISSLILTILSCQPSKTNPEREILEDSFPIIGSVNEVGLDAQKIQSLVDSIDSGFFPNRHSLLIYKDERLVLEKYFSGKDELWGDTLGMVNFTDTTLHDARSVSKSFVSAAIGIALKQGLIQSVDQKVFDFFPEYQAFRNEGREDLTIKHMLTMTGGLEWNEDIPYDNPENSEIQMTNSPDGIEFVLSRKLVVPPGTEWKYNGGTTEVLAAIIEKVSGKDIHSFCKEFLFKPLGIIHSTWTISPSTNKPAAASGLRLTPRDFLKFGVLYMNGGKWQGEEILSEQWVKDSFHPWIPRPDEGGYGYQFWVLSVETDGDDVEIPAAVGNGDQRIFFDQKNKLVVVTTAGNYNNWTIKQNAYQLLRIVLNAINQD